MIEALHRNPDSKVHGANMGPICGRQDPGGPHIGPMNFAIWEAFHINYWPFVQGIHQLPVVSQHTEVQKWVSLLLHWISFWTNSQVEMRCINSHVASPWWLCLFYHLFFSVIQLSYYLSDYCFLKLIIIWVKKNSFLFLVHICFNTVVILLNIFHLFLISAMYWIRN